MPLIHLDTVPMLILLFTLSPLIQVVAALIGRRVKDDLLSPDRPLYITRKFESNGNLYKKVFKVHKWKGLLPDGAKYFKGDFTKKNMLSYDNVYIEKFIIESCRAELIHWLGLIPFLIYFLLVPPLVASLMVLYSLIVNLPCLIAQRYNRPRLIAILELKKKLEQRKANANS